MRDPARHDFSFPLHVWPLRWMVSDPGWALPQDADAMAGDRAADPLPFLHRHETGRFPYLCVQLEQLKVHAQEMAWYGGRVLIRHPLSITDQRHFSRPVIRWVDRARTLRIRREDAWWNHPEDDIDWHEIEDEAIPAASDPFPPVER